MATVYLAKVLGEGGFERLVALKVMHPHIANEPDFVSMFLDEARLAARIRHPNVVSTLAVERNEEGLCLVMEYIEGLSLDDLVSQHGPLPIAEACEIIRQAARGLQYIHKHEMVHRDMKPSNLMVTREGIVKLTDFGIAKAMDVTALTGANNTIGTAAACAPCSRLGQISVSISTPMQGR